MGCARARNLRAGMARAHKSPLRFDPSKVRQVRQVAPTRMTLPAGQPPPLTCSGFDKQLKTTRCIAQNRRF